MQLCFSWSILSGMLKTSDINRNKLPNFKFILYADRIHFSMIITIVCKTATQPFSIFFFFQVFMVILQSYSVDATSIASIHELIYQRNVFSPQIMKNLYQLKECFSLNHEKFDTSIINKFKKLKNTIFNKIWKNKNHVK